jgi:hypothetical protein
MGCADHKLKRPGQRDVKQDQACALRAAAGSIEWPLNQQVRQTLGDGARERRARQRDFDSEGREFWSLQARSFGLRLFGHFNMRKIILTLAILYPAAALAQGAAPAEPPTFGGKPLVVVGSKKSAAGKKEKEKPLSVAQKLQACQDIDDATKERMNCYDAVYAPQPKPKAPAAKGVNDCRFLKEEDERLTCYNGFADKIPKLPR